MTATQPKPTTDSYDAGWFDQLSAVEDHHFWFTTRNDALAAVVARVTEHLPPGYRVVEVGCGTGSVLRTLDRVCRRGTLVGMDIFIEGLRHARRRTQSWLVQGDLHQPPFRRQFDVVGMFDVLEHLPDDRAILKAVRAMLAPGGALVLSVPAHRSLWSYFDEASHHCRRYEKEELLAKLADAGFSVEYATPFMATLVPLIWFGRRMVDLRMRLTGQRTSQMSTASGELRVRPSLNRLLTRILRWEVGAVTASRVLPVGSSLIVVARRAESDDET